MDSLLLEKHNLQDLLNNKNNNHKHSLLKWTLKLLVSITLVCFFLCFSSGFPMVPHSLYVYYNTWLFSFLTQSLERKYMFLICNGILAFLAKNSSFLLLQSDSIDQPQLSSFPAMNDIETNEEVPMEVNVDVEEETQHNQQELEEQKEVTEVEEKVEENDQAIEEEEESLMNKTLEEEEVIADSNGISCAPYDSEEEESREVDSYNGYEELGMSNEELNRRFEEFIRKMKEEIRIEAQRPLIITV